MPARPRTSDLRILIGAGAVTVLLSGVSYFIAPDDTTAREDGSSYSARPGGAKAAFLMLKESGYSIERSFEPLTALRVDPPRTVVVLARPSETPSQQDLRALRAFVEAGGTVVATGARGGLFLPEVRVRMSPSEPAGEARSVDAALAGPLTASAPRISMRLNATSPLPADSTYVVVYGDERAPAVIMARFGLGRAIWWADSTPLSNAAIRAPGHAELLLNTVGNPGDKAILWDEHYHGYSRSLWSYVSGTPLPLAGLHLGVVGAAALLTWSRRKWPVRPLPVEPRTSPLEFVDSMGSLYQRADVAAAAIAAARERARRVLLTSLRLPPSADDAQVSAVVAARSTGDPEKTLDLLRRSAEASRGGRIDAADAVRLVADLQRLSRRAARASHGLAAGGPDLAEGEEA